MAETETINRSLGEWAEQLFYLGHHELARRLHEDKLSTTRLLEELKLPHFRSVSCDTRDFLRTPADYFKRLSTNTFYVSVNHRVPHHPRIRNFGIDKKGTVAFVAAAVRDHGFEYDSVLLMETGKIMYGANIVISGNNPSDIYAEIVQGTHADLVGDQQPVLMTFGRDNLRGICRFENLNPFRYDEPTDRVELLYDETSIRSAFVSALLAIPHHSAADHGQDFDIRDANFKPGYYEVVFITDNPQTEHLTPKFIDYSDQKPFKIERQNISEIEAMVISILREQAILRDQAV